MHSAASSEGRAHGRRSGAAARSRPRAARREGGPLEDRSRGETASEWRGNAQVRRRNGPAPRGFVCLGRKLQRRRQLLRGRQLQQVRQGVGKLGRTGPAADRDRGQVGAGTRGETAYERPQNGSLAVPQFDLVRLGRELQRRRLLLRKRSEDTPSLAHREGRPLAERGYGGAAGERRLRGWASRARRELCLVLLIGELHRRRYLFRRRPGQHAAAAAHRDAWRVGERYWGRSARQRLDPIPVLLGHRVVRLNPKLQRRGLLHGQLEHTAGPAALERHTATLTRELRRRAGR